jgi:hypothetical protein
VQSYSANMRSLAQMINIEAAEQAYTAMQA